MPASGHWAARNQLATTVVFDGSCPAGPLAKQIGDPRVEVRYAHPRTADEVIAELISAHSAPRRLNVVSSDHAVQRAARRRRCAVTEADAFAAALLAPPPQRPAPREPRAKRTGLSDGQAEQWLDEFGLRPEERKERKSEP